MTIEPMTQEQLDAIQEREAKATDGPWESGDRCVFVDDRYTPEVFYAVVSDEVVNGTHGAAISRPEDVEFIAHAREDVPALLAEVERLRADNERLRALTTVDEDMVERAVRAFYECPMQGVDGPFRPSWDRLVAVSPDVADNFCTHTRAALDAALGTGEEA